MNSRLEEGYYGPAYESELAESMRQRHRNSTPVRTSTPLTLTRSAGANGSHGVESRSKLGAPADEF
jgi:hypothetical protein